MSETYLTLGDVATVRATTLESLGKQREGGMLRIFTQADSIGEFKPQEWE